MNELHSRAAKFVGHLNRLASADNPNRGALADLRSGLGKRPGSAPRMHPHVVPWLGPEQDYSDRWFYLVGALFGSHPHHAPGNSLGHSFRRLKNKSESMTARFIALLDCHPDDLHRHLGHAIGLLKSNDVPIDYQQLLTDLVYWNTENRTTQNRWARQFYAPEKPETKETDNE